MAEFNIEGLDWTDIGCIISELSWVFGELAITGSVEDGTWAYTDEALEYAALVANRIRKEKRLRVMGIDPYAPKE